MSKSSIKAISQQLPLELVGACLAMFTIAFNTTAIMNALILIQESLHLELSSLEWAINSYLLTVASLIILGGKLSGYIGAKKSITIGCIVFIIGSSIIVISNSLFLFLSGRVIQGIGAAIVVPATLIISKKASEKSSIAIGAWTGAIGLGLAVGPIFSGIIITFMSWHYIFFVTIPIIFFALIISFFGKINTFEKKSSFHLDIFGLLFFILGIFPLVLGLVQGNNWGWTNPIIVGLLLVGIVFLALFFITEKRSKTPLIDFSYFKNRDFLISNIGSGLSIFALFTLIYFFNLFLQNPTLLAYSPLIAAFALLPFSFALFFFSLLSAKITKTIGVRVTTSLGLLLISISFFLLHQTATDTNYNNMIFPLLILGIGLGISLSSFHSLEMSSVPDDKHGEASGIISTVNFLSALLAISIGSIFFISTERSVITHTLKNDQIAQKLLVLNFAESKESINYVLHQLSPEVRTLALNALKDSSLISFTSVMILSAFLTLTGAVSCYILIKEKA